MDTQDGTDARALEVRQDAANDRLIYGCMGLGGAGGDPGYDASDLAQAEAAVLAALEVGITRFDHADIYRGGSAEAVFGEVLRRAPDVRDLIEIQSKVGIRPGRDGGIQHYDLSGTAIRDGVHGSLERLGVDRLDVLLLHRPDPLAEPAEVAAALAGLRGEGLVDRIGVSNCSAAQILHLQQALDAPLVADQLQLSLHRHGFVDAGVLVNHPEAVGVDFPHGTLEHCAAAGIEIQAWGALAGGRYSGRPPEQPAEAETSRLVAEQARRYGVAAESVVLGWLMRHPARISPVLGTTDPGRIRACGEAESVAARMTRPEWYALYTAARGRPVP
ncbi:aldo/keto reductase [Nocardioides sambongensis]|uniref:aldo/keto reductase n=1 Tax=Nocardioides sambongensis TaxID=2589074 RepID=UPI0018C899FB|nr:aldo/keto reductase [Nocardioides sambongensis]